MSNRTCFLLFEEGKLVSIDTGAYGFENEMPETPSPECWRGKPETGSRKLDVLRVCGKPLSIDLREEETVQDLRQGDRSVYRQIRLRIEDWTYIDRDRNVMVYTFANGRLKVAEKRR